MKDKNSPYWVILTQKGLHEEPNNPGTIVEGDGGYSKILENLKQVCSELKNEIIKKDLEKSIEYLQEGIEKHDIGKIFKAHEIIHDYDYWVLNAPPSFVEYAPADWTGTRTYFGKCTIME